MRLKKLDGRYVKRQYKVIVLEHNNKIRSVRSWQRYEDEIDVVFHHCAGEPGETSVPLEVFGLADTMIRVIYYNHPPVLVAPEYWDEANIDVFYEGPLSRTEIINNNNGVVDEHHHIAAEGTREDAVFSAGQVGSPAAAISAD